MRVLRLAAVPFLFKIRFFAQNDPANACLTHTRLCKIGSETLIFLHFDVINHYRSKQTVRQIIRQNRCANENSAPQKTSVGLNCDSNNA